MRATWCDCTLSATSHLPLFFSNKLINIPIGEDANWVITNLTCELFSSSITEGRWCVHFSCKNLHVYYMWFEAHLAYACYPETLNLSCRPPGLTTDDWIEFSM